jgi:tetratricopeptide (TPR) repeat protein
MMRLVPVTALAVVFLSGCGSSTSHQARLKAEQEARTRQTQLDNLRQQGEQAYKAGRYDDAITALEAALNMQDDAGLRELLGKATEARKEARDKANKARVAELRKKGDEAMKAGKFDEAAAAFEAAAQVQDDAEIRDLVRKAHKEGHDRAMADGRKAAEAGDHHTAAMAFREALRHSPTDQEAKNALAEEQFQIAFTSGRKAFEAKQWANAVADLTGAQALKPDHKETNDMLATAKAEWRARLMDDGRQASTLGHFDEAVRAFTAARSLKRDDEVEGLLKDAQFEGHMKSGRDHLAADRPADAIAAFKAAVALKPDDATARDQLYKATKGAYSKMLAVGDAAMKAGNYSAAATAYRQALEINPKDATAQTRLKNALTEEAYTSAMAEAKGAYDKQDWARALAGYKRAIDLKPGDETALSWRRKAQREKTRRESYDNHVKVGKSYLDAKNFGLAETEFLGALDEFPGDKAATDLLNSAQTGKTKKVSYDKRMEQGKLLLAGKKYDAAETQFRAALLDFPKDEEATKLLNQALREKAKVSYDKHMLDGRGHLEGKRYADAEKEFQGALADVANDPEAKRLLGLAQAGKVKESYGKHMLAGRGHMEFKRYVDAEKEFQAALSDIPNDADAKNLLAQAKAGKAKASYDKHMLAGRGHLEFKKYADAEKEFQAALADIPGDAEAKRLLELARKKK